jgi:parallel beta-helix repeat protein
MFNRIFLILVCFAGASISAVFADAPNSVPGQVQFSAYASTNKSEEGLFTTDFIVPLYYSSDKDTLVYYNPKDTYSTPDANEIHQGVGIRHIFDDSFILGMNTFFDRRQDHSDQWFSQAGVGFEYLSHPLDMRLNWYKPTTGAKTVNTTYAFGSTDLIQYDQKIEPLQGLDFEAGVPVFDKYTKTRVYAGGYFYQSHLSKDMNGFRARTETSLTKWLSLDTTFNSNIDKRQEFYGGFRVTLSFDLFNLFNKTGKPVFSVPVISNSKDAYLEDRLFDRVVRDIDIQSKTATVQSGHDMIYVDDTNTGLQNGTLQHPYDTISQAVTAANGGKWVFVEGQGASPYAESVTLTNGIMLWGSGYNGGFKGITVSGTAPIITGSDSAAIGVALANNNTVMGLEITGFTTAGIHGTAVNNTNICYNTIVGNGVGIILGSTGDLTATLTGNNVSNNGGGGIYIESAGNLTATLTDNTANSNGGDGIHLAAGGDLTAALTDNTASNNNDGPTISGDGIYIASGADLTATLTGNTADNNSINGIRFLSGNDLTITLNNNTADNNAKYNIAIEATNNILNATLNNNDASNFGADLYGSSAGIGLVSDHGNTNATLTNNTANGNGEAGIGLESGSNLNATLTNNTANGNGEAGIGLESGSNLNATLTNNTANGNGEAGIVLISVGSITATLTGNTTNNNADNNNAEGFGIALVAETGDITATLTHNTASDNGASSSASILGVSVGNMNVTLINNIANNNSEPGILFESMGNLAATLTDNTANNDVNFGIVLMSMSGDLAATLTHNSASNNVGEGIGLGSSGNMFASLTNNTASSNTEGPGIDLESGGNMIATLTNNTANNNTGDSNGIMLGASGLISGNLTANLTNNTANGNGKDGISLFINSGTISNSSISYNIANGNANDGIDLSNNHGIISGLTILGNVSNNNTNDGIDFSGNSNSGTITGLVISNNEVDDNGNTSIDFSSNLGTISYSLINNT